MRGRKVQKLFIDGAKEKDTKEIRQLLNSNGTTETHTAPNTSQEKSFICRKKFQAAHGIRDNSNGSGPTHAQSTVFVCGVGSSREI